MSAAEETPTRAEDPPAEAPQRAEEPPADANSCTFVKADGTVCGSKFNVKDGTCLSHRTMGKPRTRKASEPKQPKAPSAPRARTTSSLEKELKETYTIAAGALYLIDTDVGQWTELKVGELAHAHAELAKRHVAVDRFFRAATSNSADAYALLQTGIWAFGAYAIMAFKRNQLSLGLAKGSAMMGVPLPQIEARLRAEWEEQKARENAREAPAAP